MEWACVEMIKQKLEKVKEDKMIIRAIEKPFDLILEARVILSEKVKMLFSFLFFSFGCLFLEHVNKPHLWFCGLVLGCYLLYDLKRKQEYYQSATSYKLNQSRNGLIESPLAPNYKGKDTNPLNLDNPNPTTKN